MQGLIGTLFESWGFKFDVASNGQEAVELAICNEGKYDVCFMDTSMPVMNGFEATKIMRQKVKYFPILSTSVDLRYEKQLLKLGADEFIAKPYEPRMLCNKILSLSVKAVKIHINGGKIRFRKEIPMDSNELKELIELDKKGLSKFSFIDSGHKFIVHKNLQNKLSNDFIAKGKLLSEFLDRSPDDPGIIHLYASNLSASKRHITPSFLDELIKGEDEMMENFTIRSEYPEKKDDNNP